MKLETHMHTSETSRCGHLSGADMAQRYTLAGYGGAIVTDHINRNTESANSFLAGYRAFARKAKKTGLLALPGAEVRLEHLGQEDFLLYGMEEGDAAFVLSLIRAEPSLSEFSWKVHEKGWLLIQAHPYRDGVSFPVPACYLDGVETANRSPRHENYDEKAQAFADKNRLIAIGGSDAHRPEDVARGGLFVPDSVRSIADFTHWLRLNRRPEIIRNDK